MRPPLFLISEREMCPRTIATMNRGNTLMMPQTRLAIALPLVCAGPKGAAALYAADRADPVGGGTDSPPGWTCEVEYPQLKQKRLLSARVVPHLGQIKNVFSLQ
jgi:hypothetical protein